MNLRRYFIGLVAVSALAACSEKAPEEPVAQEPKKEAEVVTTIGGGLSFNHPMPNGSFGEIFGLSADGSPYRYIQWDIDRNGSTDVLDVLDPKGVLVLRLFDTNGDGIIDVKRLYETSSTVDIKPTLSH